MAVQAPVLSESSDDIVTPTAVQLLIFQGTPFCNIDCKYCYLAQRSDRSQISNATVQAACRQLVAAGLVTDSIDVLWHAGEPLVLPADFYERSFATIEQELTGCRVQHKIQTNAMLINERWTGLFRKWNVAVAISLDGPPQIHDRYRVTRSGRGTCARVLEGAAMLKRADMRLSVICVVTRHSIERADELFAFFESLDVRDIGFNIDEAEGIYQRSSHDSDDCALYFKNFLQRYIELVVANRSEQRVRELIHGLMYIFKSDLRNSNIETAPLRILTVGHDGHFSTFSPELHGVVHPEFGSLIFGNVHDEHALAQISANQRFQKASRSIQRGVAACERSCDYFEVCRGGTPSNKLAEHGSFEVAETVACKFKRQAVVDVVVDMLLTGKLQGQSLPSIPANFA